MKSIRLPILLALLALAAVAGVLRFLGLWTPFGAATADLNIPASASAPPQAPLPAPVLPFPDETRWVLALIGRDIAEMGAVAGSAVLRDGAVRVEVSPAVPDAGGKPSWHLHITGAGPEVARDAAPGFIWDAAAFRDLATACLNGVAAPPDGQAVADPDGGAAMLHTLLNPEPVVLAQESLRVSGSLNKNPSDPEAHEEAALLLGAFALREHAGDFSDSRIVLCRITAHLALAGALREGRPPGPCGRMADLVVRALAGREGDLPAPAAEAAGSADEAAWHQALLLHATHDWRQVADGAPASLLEKREYFFACCASVNGAYARGHAFQGEEKPRSDWAHGILETDFSVEEGHLFAAQSIPLELGDLAQVWQAQKWPLTKENLVDELNTPEPLDTVFPTDGKPVLEVLGRGVWAAFFQRHLGQEAVCTWEWMQYKWGVKDDAVTFWTQLEGTFGQARFWPTAVLYRQEVLEHPGDAAALAPVGAHPEAFPLPLLQHIVHRGAGTGRIFQACQTFYHDITLPGGTERLGCRIQAADWLFPKQVTEAVCRDAVALNPSDYIVRVNVAHHRLGSWPSHWTSDQVREAFGPLLEYNLATLLDLAWASRKDPAAYEEIMARACVLSPNEYLTLGDYCLDHGDLDKAETAFRSGYEQATNRVWASNALLWLVQRDLDAGKDAEAEKIARECGEVYSYHGLETLIYFLERKGNLAEAEGTARKLQERYGDGEPLDDFYTRHATQYPGPYKALEAKNFPAGLQRLPDDLGAQPPPRGVRLGGRNERTDLAGFHDGDIVVGLDGYRVESAGQYTFVRALSASSEMRFVVWRNGQYTAFPATIRTRKMGVDLKDYP